MNKYSAAIVTCSDRVSRKEAKDTSGEALALNLSERGYKFKNIQVVEDDKDKIKQILMALIAEETALILTTGGTGFGVRGWLCSNLDVTPEVVRGLIDKEGGFIDPKS